MNSDSLDNRDIFAKLDAAVVIKLDAILRIGRRAVQKAQEESRKLGVPNVYSVNGLLYYELPTGELSRTDPWESIDSLRNDEMGPTG
jgi:hypothetical protein